MVGRVRLTGLWVELEAKFQRSNRALQLKFADLKKRHSVPRPKPKVEADEQEI
jgi:hypothetical protein